MVCTPLIYRSVVPDCVKISILFILLGQWRLSNSLSCHIVLILLF